MDDEVVVLAPKIKGGLADLLKDRRDSQKVADVLAGEQMSRSGDSDAGASLRRVTGLSLVGGKHIYIRGMGERYSNVLLNDLPLPSPEPSKRIVPLDLFPVGILESVVVTKNFDPAASGEMSGGLISLRTKSLPDKPFVKMGVGLDLGAPGSALSVKGGRLDQWGVDDGSRRLPSSIRSALGSGRQLVENNPPFLTNGFSARELAAMGRELKPRYGVRSDDAQTMPSLSLAVGQKWRHGPWSFGVAGSGSYGRQVEEQDKRQARYNVGAGQLTLDQVSQVVASSRDVRASLTVDVGSQYGKRTEVAASGLLLRHSNEDVETRVTTRTNDSVQRVRSASIEWTERELMVTQLRGRWRNSEDPEPQWEAHWRLQSARAERLSPDRREYQYLDRGVGFEFDLSPNGNRRVWSELSDQTYDASAELRWRPTAAGGRLQLKTGLAGQSRERRSDTWRLHLRNRFPSGQLPDLTRPIEDILDPEQIREDGFVLTNLTESADSYRAEQEVFAAFGEATWQITPEWVWTSGIRRESAEQSVDTFFYFSPDTPTSRAGIRTLDWLPGHGLTWRPNDRWRARLTYSETVARPEFRELSSAPFLDEETGYEVVGNPNLRGTVVRGVDHRWEFFPSPAEVLSFGVFAKNFTAPIEEIFEPGPNLRKTYANADSARNVGAEFEARIELSRLGRGFRRWSVAGNLTLIDSQVELGRSVGGLQTSDQRPLQGQSPWLANFQVQYERPLRGTVVTLLINAIGPRITEVGTAGRPDIYEQSFTQVDMVMSQKIDRQSTLGLRLKNILDPELRATQGGEEVRALKRGSAYVVSWAAEY